MKYTFKNSKREESLTVVLSDYNILVRNAQGETIISYSSITKVRLCKASGAVYKVVLFRDGYKSLTITNAPSDNNDMDQSRMYSTFVRVLHYHLKEKSHAEYSSGCQLEGLWKWGFIGALVSFLISFTANYLGFRPINPYLGAMAIAGIVGIVLFTLNKRQLSSSYTPGEIPFNLLP